MNYVTTKIIPLCALCAIVHSAEFGLGVAVSPDLETRLLSAPIRFESILIEPFTGFSTLNENQDARDITQNAYSVGMGIFATKKIREQVEFLAGGRVSYERTDYTIDNTDPTYEAKYSTNGFIVEPAIGFDWFVHDGISLGIEGGIKFSQYNTTNSGSGSDYHIEQKRVDSVSKLILRVYF